MFTSKGVQIWTNVEIDENHNHIIAAPFPVLRNGRTFLVEGTCIVEELFQPGRVHGQLGQEVKIVKIIK